MTLRMREVEFRGWEVIRGHGLGRWLRVVGTIAGLFGFAMAATFFAAVWAKSGSALAWRDAGWLLIAVPALFVAISALAWFARERVYRMTKAQPLSDRGFDIEPRSANLTYGKAITTVWYSGLGVEMDAGEQRQWEKTRTRGATWFLLVWTLIMAPAGAFPFLLFGWLENWGETWQELWWVSILFAVGCAGCGIVVWFFTDWRYRKAQGRLTHA